MPAPWMIDELAYAGPEHLDADFVAGYDRKQGTIPDDHAAAGLAVLQAHGIGPKSTIVDLGAGTGRFTLAAARVVGRVVAVDVSPAMLEFLGDRVAAAGFTNVSLVRAGFLSYTHEGPAPDAVYTRNALHQLPDFWKALALQRIADLLPAGGILRLHDLVYDFQPGEAAEVFERWFDRAAEDPAAGYTRDDYAVHIRTEYSTYRWLLEPMLEATGFEILDAEFHTVFATYTCIRP